MEIITNKKEYKFKGRETEYHRERGRIRLCTKQLCEVCHKMICIGGLKYHSKTAKHQLNLIKKNIQIVN